MILFGQAEETDRWWDVRLSLDEMSKELSPRMTLGI
jgi:hypothetical protein